MNDTQSGAAVTVEAIETAFDGRWGIWLSGTGRWWARQEEPSATGPQPAGPDAAGPGGGGPGGGGPGGTGVMLVRADDPDELRARIQEHEARPREASIRVPGGSPAGRAMRGRGRGRVPG
jgi:hypothetical protein